MLVVTDPPEMRGDPFLVHIMLAAGKLPLCRQKRRRLAPTLRVVLRGLMMKLDCMTEKKFKK